MTRRTVSLLVLGLAVLVILWLAADVLLAVFAGILIAVFLRGGGDWMARHLHVRSALGLSIFCILLVLATAGFLAFAGAALADQVQKFVDSLPDAIESARNFVGDHDWIQRGLQMIDPSTLFSSGSGATSIFSSSLGALGTAVVIAFVGLYGAIAPGTYVRGFVALLAPSLRRRALRIIGEAGVALRGWLKAQFISMAIVGILTGLGLWAIGIPFAPILAILAAVLTFIPNIGPVLAALPALLLGLSDGLSATLWVAGLYVAVQTVESYLITPRIQEESVSLPPALTISAQLLFGVLFGLLGLALATPLAAVALRLGKIFYVEDYLDAERRPDMRPAPASGSRPG
ncbi:AI-2E family transporter [Fulvimarina sp. 2208YS6-2-32]|uniref:AI-2E family transporter n=1 Tax=Fulvimarina uroteuthidis TaxID=3098149 RepID=A0ABU5I424_9HYPH|nr:AI-2E family transporter [Fulvimarina sp. 2208YS6-2-32]MDY8110129.1 AI-2E family transporter [Fulvimarina sp. 2208YS6-2-32]